MHTLTLRREILFLGALLLFRLLHSLWHPLLGSCQSLARSKRRRWPQGKLSVPGRVIAVSPAACWSDSRLSSCGPDSAPPLVRSHIQPPTIPLPTLLLPVGCATQTISHSLSVSNDIYLVGWLLARMLSVPMHAGIEKLSLRAEKGTKSCRFPAPMHCWPPRWRTLTLR